MRELMKGKKAYIDVTILRVENSIDGKVKLSNNDQDTLCVFKVWRTTLLLLLLLRFCFAFPTKRSFFIFPSYTF